MRLKFIASALLSLAVANAKLVMVIRHGEKLNDKVTNLSEKGQARADCLINVFGPNGILATPQKIYAQSPSEKKQSTRPRDTVMPLAQTLGLDIDLSYTSGKVKKLVKDIEDSPEEIILISWSNDKIGDIAGKFDIKKTPKWNGDVFDDIWIMTDGKTPYIKKPGVEITPNTTILGKGNMNLYIIKENVDDCIAGVIDAINHKTYKAPTAETTEILYTKKNDNNGASQQSNLSSQSNETVTNGNTIADDNTSDSKILKTSIITVTILAFAALGIIY